MNDSTGPFLHDDGCPDRPTGRLTEGCTCGMWERTQKMMGVWKEEQDLLDLPPADVLRQAATLLRERADEANTPEARRPYGDRRIEPVPEDGWAALVGDTYLGGEIGAYCALMHPPVGQAVARMLDRAASDADMLDENGADAKSIEHTLAEALETAREILRERTAS